MQASQPQGGIVPGGSADAGPIDAVSGFAAYLREAGFAVGVAEQRLMVEALLAVGVGRPALVRPAWRAIVSGDRERWRRYPELFDAYWFPQRARGTVRTSGATRPRRDLRDLVRDLQAAPPATSPDPRGAAAGGPPGALGEAPADTATEGERRTAQGGASRAEPLERRDFTQWTDGDLQRLEQVARGVERRLRRRLMRRRERHAAGVRLDVRRTLRTSLRFGGLPLSPHWQRRRTRPPRVFLLVDVSRSMETHAPLYLRAARAFCEAIDARAFVFHTRIAEITALLRRRSGRVQERINAVTFGFGGGTRIATSLHAFAEGEARDALEPGALVMVLSDGYDTDPPHRLAESLAAIRARGARVAWLHPNRRASFGEALSRARDAGLVDAFAPAHDLASLERLPALLSFGGSR